MHYQSQFHKLTLILALGGVLCCTAQQSKEDSTPALKVEDLRKTSPQLFGLFVDTEYPAQETDSLKTSTNSRFTSNMPVLQPKGTVVPMPNLKVAEEVVSKMPIFEPKN
ncbi:hypothetical protein [Croceiramulus getboli]|nr:hypothetical protein P8624_09765 [Flavobacteriaceae bacterium YJPT1-3]